MGFKRSSADHTMFTSLKNSKICVILVYVDDIIMTGDDIDFMPRVKDYLNRLFEIKDLGTLRFFLRIEVAHSNKEVFLYQKKYTLDLLKETGCLGTKPAETPLEVNCKLKKDEGELVENVQSFQKLVGKLIYLTVTRPDISYVVSLISQFMHSPRSSHVEAAHRILRYLKRCPGKGILMKRDLALDVVGYTDADWAGDPNDRRFTSGFCTFVGGNLVTWRSKKQSVVARSSAEAEYRAMAWCTCELVWIKSLLKDMNIDIKIGKHINSILLLQLIR
ncbi:uncharacterized mitochondrial protein AtMg00810-like [Nymphaea colorata]|uniref:uncharacterized mitochondrial protein AtMg00810-like n=1 Tax=Nymphaea colorata TaxID=210225 RepID=UPI00129DDA82|nr:uncharacterized mitochondrial protein AtMg00810-like [Nymphaea colorata]